MQKPKKYLHILFDLDGTLVDSEPGILQGFRIGLEHFGKRVDDATLRTFIGPPIMDSFRSIPGFTEAQAVEAVRVYRTWYAAEGLFRARAYDGMPEALCRMHEAGCHLYIATSKPTVYAEKIAAHFGFAPYLTGIVGSNLDNSRSDKAEVIRAVLTQYGISDAASVLMVGDRKFDLNGAARAGVDGLGVTFGFGSREELSREPHVAVCDTPDEVAAFVLDGV